MSNKNRKYYGPLQIGGALDKVTKPILNRRGFAENKIIVDWDKIAGERIAKFSSPRKIYFQKEKRSEGVLHVEVYDSSLAMEMTYIEPVIIEKIAAYFGYKAVAKIKIIQNLKKIVDDKQEAKPEIILSNKNNRSLNDSLADIEDEEMRLCLQKLGSDVLCGNQE